MIDWELLYVHQNLISLKIHIADYEPKSRTVQLQDHEGNTQWMTENEACNLIDSGLKLQSDIMENSNRIEYPTLIECHDHALNENS